MAKKKAKAKAVKKPTKESLERDKAFLRAMEESAKPERLIQECKEAGARIAMNRNKPLLDLFGIKEDTKAPRRPRVYISGPITKGDREDNFDQADEMNRQLIEAGFAPLNPMFSMFSRYAFEIKHSDWMEVDLAWIECADAVIRLPGESVGADMETSHAEKLGIPVFKSVEDLKVSMGMTAALEAKASK